MKFRTAGGVEYGTADEPRDTEAQEGRIDLGVDGRALVSLGRVLVRLEELLERSEDDARFAWDLERSQGKMLLGQKERIDAAESTIDELNAEVDRLYRREGGIGPGVILWDGFNDEPANLDNARRAGRLEEYLEQVRVRVAPEG